MLPKLCHFYFAPWTRYFKTFYLRGRYAHELQLGPIVIQILRRGQTWQFGCVNIWKDHFWR